jgi:hypothetical protein
MISLQVAAEVVSWSSWLWQHREALQPILQRCGNAGDFAQAALHNPDGDLRRVGNTLIFGQAHGGEQVLAFVEQTAPQVASIQQAVGGIQAHVVPLSYSLASLQNLSMLTLGLSAFTPLVLGAQFLALQRRLGAIQQGIKELHKKLDANSMAQLRTGLDLQRQGADFLEAHDRANAHQRLSAALPFCIHSMKYFSELLGGELQQPKVRRVMVSLLARHLAVALVGVASCQIGLEQDQHAFAQSLQELSLLRQATRTIFQQTVARDPAPYLLPPLRAHGVTLDLMARLFQQARDAGALDPAADASVSAWFEAHRDAIFRARPPRLRSERWCRQLRSDLQEAMAAVEEMNRVVGLSRLVEQVRGSGQSTLAVMTQLRAQAAGPEADRDPYRVWGLG